MKSLATRKNWKGLLNINQNVYCCMKDCWKRSKISPIKHKNEIENSIFLKTRKNETKLMKYYTEPSSSDSTRKKESIGDTKEGYREGQREKKQEKKPSFQ